MSRHEFDKQQVEDLFSAALQVVRDATLAEGGDAYFARRKGFDALKAAVTAIEDDWADWFAANSGETSPVSEELMVRDDMCTLWAAGYGPTVAVERGFCPRCFAETNPGDQVAAADGSCWPECPAE